MFESPEESIEPGKTGTSRRTALKLGAGAGVGLVAWSGMSITSLGGTPAYAAGCTFVIEIDLSGGCRNTTQDGTYGYQPLDTGDLPDGYTIVNNIPNKTACEDNWVATLTFPDGITCAASIQFFLPPQCTGASQGSLDFGPSSDGSLDLTFSCAPGVTSSTQYTITAKCNTTGAPDDCLS